MPLRLSLIRWAKRTDNSSSVPQSELEFVFCLLAPPSLEYCPSIFGPEWLSTTAHSSHQEGEDVPTSFRGTTQKWLTSFMFKTR